MSFSHLDAVLEEVRPLGELFAQAGFRLFLVGGIVRDQWLNYPLDTSSDIDLTTDARPVDIKRVVAPIADVLWTQGERFGTIGLRTGGRDIEITTHRAESYTSDSRKPQVSFGDDIKTDLSRRDFTVNAMAIELPDGDLVDPCGGVADLAARQLRTPLSADISFNDDPLRMLRAARFATRYQLTPTSDLVASAGLLNERLRIVAIERIGVEVRRLLELDAAAVGLRFLADTGVLGEVLAYGDPTLLDLVAARAPRAIDAVKALSSNWHLRLAGVGLVIFDDAPGVTALCARLRLSNNDTRTITRLAKSATALIETAEPTAASIRRWIANCDDHATATELARVVGPNANHVEAFANAVHALVEVEGSGDMVFLGGEAIMAELSVGPGPTVGRATAYLRTCYFEQGPLTEAQQRTLLRSWWAEQT